MLKLSARARSSVSRAKYLAVAQVAGSVPWSSQSRPWGALILDGSKAALHDVFFVDPPPPPVWAWVIGGQCLFWTRRPRRSGRGWGTGGWPRRSGSRSVRCWPPRLSTWPAGSRPACAHAEGSGAEASGRQLPAPAWLSHGAPCPAPPASAPVASGGTAASRSRALNLRASWRPPSSSPASPPPLPPTVPASSFSSRSVAALVQRFRRVCLEQPQFVSPRSSCTRRIVAAHLGPRTMTSHLPFVCRALCQARPSWRGASPAAGQHHSGGRLSPWRRRVDPYSSSSFCRWRWRAARLRHDFRIF